MAVSDVPSRWWFASKALWKVFQRTTFRICYRLCSLLPKVRLALLMKINRNVSVLDDNLVRVMRVWILTESLDSVSELPKSVNQQLQHLAKGRPKRAKTRAPSRSHIRNQDETDESGTLDTFFRPGSATPSTTTPLISPNSDDR